jgi:hypothetical protein
MVISYQKISLVLAQAHEKMKKCDFFEGDTSVPAFPTVHDAVIHCRRAIVESERL